MRTTRLKACPTVLGLISLVATGCERPTGGQTARAEAHAAPPVARVLVVRPERGTVRRVSEQPGQIEAAETTPIYAKIGGYVEKVAVDIGDRVKKDQVLAELRVPEFDAALRQKRASVKQAEAERKQCESAVEVAQAGIVTASARIEEDRSGIKRAAADVSRWEAEYGRVDQLFRRHAVEGSLLDETRSKLRAAEASRDEVRARIRSAEAALAEARALLDKARADLEAATSHIEVARSDAEHAEAMAGYARLTSPFDGVVVRRGIDTGHLATPGTAGEPPFVVARSDVMTIVVGVPESDAPAVDPGDRAEVRLPALGGRNFPGKVTRTAWALSPATRTLRAEIDLPNPDGVLRPGLYAYVAVVAEEHPDVLTLPVTAVVSAGAGAYCVTVAGGEARRTPVELGLSDGKRVEVRAGVGPGDAVVERNAESLADGQRVEPSEAPAAAKGKG